VCHLQPLRQGPPTSKSHHQVVHYGYCGRAYVWSDSHRNQPVEKADAEQPTHEHEPRHDSACVAPLPGRTRGWPVGSGRPPGEIVGQHDGVGASCFATTCPHTWPPFEPRSRQCGRPRPRRIEQVIAVMCKAWQAEFDAPAMLAQLRGDGKNLKTNSNSTQLGGCVSTHQDDVPRFLYRARRIATVPEAHHAPDPYAVRHPRQTRAVIISTFGAFISGPLAGLWTGESGIVTVLVTVAVVALLVRGTWRMRKAPGDLPFAEARATAI
jgi:hypothetical protein